GRPCRLGGRAPPARGSLPPARHSGGLLLHARRRSIGPRFPEGAGGQWWLVRIPWCPARTGVLRPRTRILARAHNRRLYRGLDGPRRYEAPTVSRTEF